MTATVLAAAHGPDGPDAVALAVDLARLNDAAVVVAGIYVVPLGPYVAAYEQAARAELHGELERVAALIPSDVPHTVIRHGCSGVVRGLHELAEPEDVQAIVVGANHLGAVGRLLRGDVAVGLLHDAPCAVAVAPRGWASRGEPFGTGAVGVAWDGSPESELALAEAVRIAEATGATLRIVHVVEPLPPSTDLALADDASFDDHRLRWARAQAADAAARVHGRCPVEIIVLDGVDAADALVELSESLNALVLGSRGYGPLRRVLFGSVSSQVVHRAACPVLVLPRGVAEASASPAAASMPEHAAR